MSLINEKPSEESSFSRRGFLKALSGIFGGFIVFTAGIPMLESVAGRVTKKIKSTYSKLTQLASLPVKKPVNLTFVMTEHDAFIKNVQPENVWAVKKSDDESTVYSPICPHLGCRYLWHEDKQLFICPCHNSVFNIDGQVVSGPAPRPLDTLPTKTKNNYLYVLWERFKPGLPNKEII